MGDKKTECTKPENLKGKPSQCSPTMIRICHGDAKGHPCTDKPKK